MPQGPLVDGSGREAVVGETEEYWLSAEDFISTDGAEIRDLVDLGALGAPALGFPRDWPAVYGRSRALKALVGKRGRCAGRRVAVVGLPIAGELALVAGLRARPLQSFGNAEAVAKAVALPVVRGWAVLERLDGPPGEAFVAERFWWNALPDGRWVDFTPRPAAWPQLLLAEAAGVAAAGATKVKAVLGAGEAELLTRVFENRFREEASSAAAGGARDGRYVVPNAFGADMAHLDADKAPSAPSAKPDAEDLEFTALKAELAQVTREADEACAEQRRWEAEAAALRRELRQGPTLGTIRWQPPEDGAGFRPGSLVCINGLTGATDLNGQDATLLRWDEGRGRWKVRLSTGELRAVQAANLELVAEARERPELSTFGCEVTGRLPPEFGGLSYNLWPLVYSGILRARLPDRLLARLNAQLDALYADRETPSHALFLQAEVKQGKQLTIRNPDEEYASVLLGCAEKLATAVLQEDAARYSYKLDQVWSVHQLAGDYNPVHFHTNAISHFGFSSFLHLQLPPQLHAARQRLPASGARGRHDGVTSFVWKADVGGVGELLQSPGGLECELAEGYLYVFPQWLQHYVWPFRGPGERRTLAANVGLLSASVPPSAGVRGEGADPSDPRGATRASRYR